MEKILPEKANKLSLQNINGFLLTTGFPVKHYEQTISFKPRPDDIIIAGYPKSGTTWMQYIVWDIINKGAPLLAANEMWTKEVPHLEMVGTDGLENLKPPRLFKVNLPFNLTPYHPSVKYIYVFRNPWDCCISASNMMKEYDENFSEGSFDDYFEYFITGQVTHGDYFDHLLSWYTRWNDPKVFFITYEEMNRNTLNAVLKISQFMGTEYFEMLNKNEKMLEKILQQIQFDHMKQNCPAVISEISNCEMKSPRKIEFFHSGKIGQWKNYFKKEQMEKMKEKVLQKLGKTEMFSMWRNTEVFDIMGLNLEV